MTALALCRFTHFLAAMLVFGMSAYLWAYAPERLRLAFSPAVRRIALIASVVTVISAIAWLALESGSMADEWSAAVDPDAIGAVLTDTAFGHVWATHLVLSAALVAVIVFGPRARWMATSVVSAALLASLGLVGHAAMQSGAEGVLHRANHALPGASGRETRHRRDHDFARAFQSLCSRAATQGERKCAEDLTRNQRSGSRARLRRHRARQCVCALRSGVKPGSAFALHDPA